MSTTPTERPILFNAPMVRAILAGTKPQTRRIAPISRLDTRPLGDGMIAWSAHFAKPLKGINATHSGGRFTKEQTLSIIASSHGPYGKPGDRLWVRETWAYGIHAMASARDEDGPFVYAATDSTQHRLCEKWTPSIHMPRWASRITLEITAVRVEKLQDITDSDALAEGVDRTNTSIGGYAKERYKRLWNAINGDNAWDKNPWVWVVEFKRVTP